MVRRTMLPALLSQKDPYPMPTLFDPIRLGAIEAPNRILMAPLTRGRSTRAHVPTPMMAEYYAQRASAGLILTEATGISQVGLGWPYAPGIWSAEQVAAWRVVTDAVHAAGGRIACQLWHMGRLVHSSVTGAQPVSSSATTAPDHAYTYEGKKPYEQARALTREEIPALLDDYRHAARNALKAGFDGVQVHAANGYLIDEFLRDNSNFRTDEYGGPIENRIRLLREVTGAVVDTVGASRTGVRLSPNGNSQGANDSNPVALFTAAAAALSDLGIAYLELREPGFEGTFGKADVPPIAPAIRRVFAGPLILNSDYDGVSGQKQLDEGTADAITFGRTFIANPDLPYRLAHKLTLAKDDAKTWYSQGPEGYIDYPTAA
jgi:2,4-dienoyl-CoA reductase-like NADH-dependent reductase (Old Yellow Enzyme family)